MRRLNSRSIVPPDYYRFTHETGHTTVATTYPDWLDAAKEHRRANSLPIPADLSQKMEDQLCGMIPPEYCTREVGDSTDWVDTRFGWDDFVDGMKLFGEWGLAGTPMVPQGEANRRAGICLQCPYNVNISGCPTCRKIATYITGNVAQRKTPHDDSLKACAVCKCAVKAMVWFPAEMLSSHESPDRQRVRPNFCWAKAGSETYVGGLN